jgi:hypothetical protein
MARFLRDTRKPLFRKLAKAARMAKASLESILSPTTDLAQESLVYIPVKSYRDDEEMRARLRDR